MSLIFNSIFICPDNYLFLAHLVLIHEISSCCNFGCTYKMERPFFYKASLLLIFMLVVNMAKSQLADTIYIKQLIDSALNIEFSDNALAQKTAQQAKLLAEKNKFPKLHSRALVLLGYLQDDIGNFGAAKTFYEQSLAINLKENNQKQLALDYSNLGLNAENTGDYSKAIDYHNKGFRIREEIRDSAGLSASMNNLGNIYGWQGDYAKALDYFLRSLQILEKTGDESKLPPQLNNVGIVYFRLHNSKKALEYYEKALKVWTRDNNKEGMATVSTNIANLYKEAGNYDKAFEFSNKALKLNEEIENKAGVAESYNLIGSVYSQLNQHSKALDYFEKALKLQQELNGKTELVMIYNNMASVYLETNKADKAITLLEQSLPLAKENHLMLQLKEIYKLYYRIYKTDGNYNLALKYHELYFAINDSVYNIESTKQLNELNTRYETEKKEKENQLLQIENDLSGKTIRQQKMVVIFIIIGLGLSVVLIFFIFKNLKQQRKANKIISGQKQEVEIKNAEIEEQKHVIEEKQKEIVDSINYAKRIQYALLASDELLASNLPAFFVLFKPKDIVSGDFYWATEHKNKFYLAVCDSTGHGVPGAFMSLLNIGFLSEAIKEKEILEPHEVFNYTRKRLIESIGKDEQQDGMDGILLCIDKSTGSISYAAANNNPVLVRNISPFEGVSASRRTGDVALIDLPKDKMPVGKGELMQSFKLHTIDLQAGDNLYLYTDGYADQFGGPKGKKFKYKQLEDLLQVNAAQSCETQKRVLDGAIEDWKGSLEQVDDILLIGIKA